MGEYQQGLAQQAAAQGVGGAGQQMPTVQEIAQALMQGITPDQLIQAGIPQELVQQAIQLVRQMQAQQQGAQGQASQAPQGLAQQATMAGAAQ